MRNSLTEQEKEIQEFRDKILDFVEAECAAKDIPAMVICNAFINLTITSVELMSNNLEDLRINADRIKSAIMDAGVKHGKGF